MVLIFYGTGVTGDRCGGGGILDIFSSCDLDLDLDPMTFVYEIDPRIAWRYTGCANMNFLSQGFRKSSSDRQTDIHRIDRNCKPRRFAGGQKSTWSSFSSSFSPPFFLVVL